MVQRVWRTHELAPHRVRTFKLSNDKRFVEKLVDVVGLYLRPPEHALVLSVDEKSQIQALDRTQPRFALQEGPLWHDDARLQTETGPRHCSRRWKLPVEKLIGQCMKRHRHQEWLKFLKLIDAETPAELDLHLIVDNYGTHKHSKVRAWLAKHPRFNMHFIPTSSSWLNMVERWFREITTKRIRRGSFRSVAQLEAAIQAFIDAHKR